MGTGSPAHLTLEGREALRSADVILVPEKGSGKDDLAGLRRTMLTATGSTARELPFTYPLRDPALPYLERVERWHDAIAARWAEALAGHTGTAALLVWGDPSLYDSTLRIAARLSPKPPIRVIPGITSLQALTAAHAIPLNTLDGAVQITTGRRLREEGLPNGPTTVVMLDGEASFQHLTEPGLHIWWGAYLGMPEQILAAGALPDIASQIVETRAAARAAHGWLMDTYLIRRT
ncbi:MAG: precorrin-6A synthase (deacetylating) [Pseudomonadota bacterium]